LDRQHGATCFVKNGRMSRSRHGAAGAAGRPQKARGRRDRDYGRSLRNRLRMLPVQRTLTPSYGLRAAFFDAALALSCVDDPAIRPHALPLSGAHNLPCRRPSTAPERASSSASIRATSRPELRRSCGLNFCSAGVLTRFAARPIFRPFPGGPARAAHCLCSPCPSCLRSPCPFVLACAP